MPPQVRMGNAKGASRRRGLRTRSRGAATGGEREARGSQGDKGWEEGERGATFRPPRSTLASSEVGGGPGARFGTASGVPPRSTGATPGKPDPTLNFDDLYNPARSLVAPGRRLRQLSLGGCAARACRQRKRCELDGRHRQAARRVAATGRAAAAEVLTAVRPRAVCAGVGAGALAALSSSLRALLTPLFPERSATGGQLQPEANRGATRPGSG